MKTKHIALLGAGIIALLAGCVSKPIALLPVGPDTTSRAMLGAKGYLQVFSATEKSNAVASDDYTYFNLHSGYDINDASRKSVKFLPNHASNMDEWPD